METLFLFVPGWKAFYAWKSVGPWKAIYMIPPYMTHDNRFRQCSWNTFLCTKALALWVPWWMLLVVQNCFLCGCKTLNTLFLNRLLHELLSWRHPFNCSPAWNTAFGICGRKPFIHSNLLFIMSFWCSKEANYSGIIRIRLLDRRQKTTTCRFKKCMRWRIYLPQSGCSRTCFQNCGKSSTCRVLQE